MSYLDGLNEMQREAVTTINGPVLVVAGPGSGKTRVLTYRIAHLIESGVPPYHILALTFTNKAAKEMKERIAAVVGNKANYVWAGTFHSIFARILRTEAKHIGFPSDFTIYDAADAKSLIKTIVKEMNLDPKVYADNAVASRISNAKSNLISPSMYENDSVLRTEDNADKKPELFKIYKTYAMRCKRAGAMDFDDLLYQLYILFHKNPENILDKYREKFPYLLVDEFQDTNFLQSAIVSKLVKYENSPQNICVVGDDAQSIYSFRGATIQNILDFERDFPSLTTIKLEQNYRSTDYIVQAANEIITNNTNQIPKKIWSNKGAGEKIKILKTSTDAEEGNRIAASIQEQKNKFLYAFKDFAILYRTNSQSRVFEEQLRRFNIPYRIYGGMSFYQRKEIKDVVAYLRLTLNPLDDEAFRRSINTPKRGIGDSTVDQIAQYAEANRMSMFQVLMTEFIETFSTKAANGLKSFRDMILSFRAKNQEGPDAYEIAHLIINQSTFLSNLKEDKTIEGQSRYENVIALLDGIKEFVENDEIIDEATLPDKSLTSYLQNIALVSDLDKEDDDDNKVTLMSVHAAKGLEFKSVFVTGMEENLFPSFMSKSSMEGIDEERRLFYVAVTRAEANLTISYANSRYQYGNVKFNEPSRFLNEISADNFDNHEIISKQTSVTSTAPISGVSGAFNRPSVKVIHSTNVDISNFKASPESELQEGKVVLHQRFGKGTIMSIEGGIGNKVASISFEEAGIKKIMLKFAKLQVLEN